jgi:hypothetical protein
VSRGALAKIIIRRPPLFPLFHGTQNVGNGLPFLLCLRAIRATLRSPRGFDLLAVGFFSEKSRPRCKGTALTSLSGSSATPLRVTGAAFAFHRVVPLWPLSTVG